MRGWQNKSGGMWQQKNVEVKVLLYLLTHLSPRVGLDLGEFELSVVGVHLADLFSGWSTENLKRNSKGLSTSTAFSPEIKVPLARTQ